MCQLSLVSAVGNQAKSMLALGKGVGWQVATVVWYRGESKGAPKRGCVIPWAGWRLVTGTWHKLWMAGTPRKPRESLGICGLDLQRRERDSR